MISWINIINNIISKRKFGSRYNNSTKEALAYVSRIILINFDYSYDCNFCDHMKALDVINHGNLLLQLNEMGIRG